jgi:hypothetical protein
MPACRDCNGTGTVCTGCCLALGACTCDNGKFLLEGIEPCRECGGSGDGKAVIVDPPYSPQTLTVWGVL